MIRIHIDINSQDEEGRVMLIGSAARADLERYGDQIVEGATALFYMPEEFEVRGTLAFDGMWRAVPDWDTIQHYNPDDTSG